MAEKPNIDDLSFIDDAVADKDIHDCKDFMTSFTKAVKEYGLYPETHSMSEKIVDRVKSSLDNLLNSHQHIRFTVKKDSIRYEDDIVYQGPVNDDNMAYLLYRDGIQWFEFQKGIDADELTEFFKLMKKYASPQEEAEGDLVTSLWEMNLPNINYEAMDVLWDDAPLIDFNLLNAETDKKEEADLPAADRIQIPVSIAAKMADPRLCELSPVELLVLQKMVATQEKPGTQEDVLDVLLIILEKQDNEKDFISILNFQKEELYDTLERGEFHFAATFLKNMKSLRKYQQKEKPWIVSLIKNFFIEISGSDFLTALTPFWKILDTAEVEYADEFRSFLLWLPAEAILALVPILADIQSPHIHDQLEDIIIQLARKNLQPMKQLLNNTDESVILKAIQILGRLDDRTSENLLVNMSRHTSERIRRQALKSLVDRETDALQMLFSLIEDKSPAVSKMMMDYLGKKRDRTAENLLLEYLEFEKYRITGKNHILACYKTLGQCGSERSMPFLKSALLNQPWSLVAAQGRQLHRQGAAMALTAMKKDESEQILEKAARSLFPSLRRAYKKAVEDAE